MCSKAMPKARSRRATRSPRWHPARPKSLAFVSQSGDGDEGDRLAPLDLQRDHRALVEAGEQLVELIDRLELSMLALVDHGEQHIALAHVGARAGLHFRDDDATLHLHVLLLVGRELRNDDAQ